MTIQDQMVAMQMTENQLNELDYKIKDSQRRSYRAYVERQRDKFNEYSRKYYNENIDYRLKKRMSAAMKRYDDGKSVGNKLVDELRVYYNKSAIEMPYKRSYH